MTYLVITDNLIDNLDDLEINELKYEKIKSDEIINSTSVSLFSDDSYKFVTDEFFTYKKLEQINYEFNSKYIFQVKKERRFLSIFFLLSKIILERSQGKYSITFFEL